MSHEVRRKIIRNLGESGELSFSQMLDETGTDQDTLGYHLNKLGRFVERGERFYSLTEDGLLAYQVLKESDDIEKNKLTAEIVNEPRVSKYILGFYKWRDREGKPLPNERGELGGGSSLLCSRGGKDVHRHDELQ